MKNIYLVGMPGSGKSTLGRLIAQEMKREFMDTDEEIRKRFGCTPEQIILLQGEEKLREVEKELLSKLLSESGLIISTGGGFPVYNENMKLMNKSGITVYLHYDVSDLWERLENDRKRPLSSSLKSTERLLNKRENIYKEAQINLCGVEDLEMNLTQILGLIRERFPEEF